MAQLRTPLGQQGSGRLRYGAAMALYQAGQLSAEALEVFRICAARDSEDPATLLRERGMTLPSMLPSRSTPAITALVEAIDVYLDGLTGRRIAEVREGIATWRDGPIGPQPGRVNPVVSLHLAAALAPLCKTHPMLAGAINDAVPHLDWLHFSDYPVEQIGAAFLAGNAYCILIGESGPIKADGFDLGLFLIAPHLLYRDHHHKAPELYAPLTGPHGWRFGPGTPLVLKAAHEPVWNEPDVPHLTKVGPVPFLCIYAWTRDVNDAPRVIPAADWAELEALRING